MLRAPSCCPCTPLLLMAHSSHYRNLLLALAVAALLEAGEASGVGFNLHHRFSPVVRRWAEARGHPGAWWPEARQSSTEYYSALSRHDRAIFARRGLADGNGLLSFADGNATVLDGTLHYAEVAVGTPNATFLVALDTGSDLFWVPCDCKHCAPIANATVQGGPELRPYSPRQSSTSKTVTCEHELCQLPNACATRNSSCPYVVRYVSANTSSSGVLVEDVLYLTREKQGGAAAGEVVKAPIVFGCGQEQTGSFLDGPAADGLMGLGTGKVSVPSVLARSGLVTSDSFSMCFSRDGVGRINFGDAGSRGQAETPFIVSGTQRSPIYNISITSMKVGSKSLPVGFAAVVDSGTSFTYLSDPAYTELTTNFNSQIRERRANFSGNFSGGSFPFEYCYGLSPNQTMVELPVVSLTTKGGALFPVIHSVARIFAEQTNGQDILLGYCLVVVKNDISIDIIGQNFMTGLKVVFDRQRSVLGWQKFDCYRNARMEDDPVDGSPSPAPGPTAVHLKPQENDATNNRPVRRPTGAGHVGRCAFGGVSFILILLPLHLLVAAAV